MIECILYSDKVQDQDVWLYDYDMNYLTQILLDIIDKEIYVSHDAYGIVIVRMFERISCIFYNDACVWHGNGDKHYYEVNVEKP